MEREKKKEGERERERERERKSAKEEAGHRPTRKAAAKRVSNDVGCIIQFHCRHPPEIERRQRPKA
jgi:hypothetical protein